MFMVRRSLPPYPISMTFRASGSAMAISWASAARGRARWTACGRAAGPTWGERIARRDPGRACLGRLERQRGRKDLVLLREEHGPDLRNIALGPVFVLGQLSAQPLALVQAVEGPEMNDLVKRAELRVPEAL